jgi:hypothetical protein
LADNSVNIAGTLYKGNGAPAWAAAKIHHNFWLEVLHLHNCKGRQVIRTSAVNSPKPEQKFHQLQK